MWSEKLTEGSRELKSQELKPYLFFYELLYCDDFSFIFFLLVFFQNKT